MKKTAAVLLVFVATGNPAGFSTAHALKVGRIDIDIASLTKDVIVMRQIAVVAPSVLYEKVGALGKAGSAVKGLFK